VFTSFCKIKSYSFSETSIAAAKFPDSNWESKSNENDRFGKNLVKDCETYGRASSIKFLILTIFLIGSLSISPVMGSKSSNCLQ